MNADNPNQLPAIRFFLSIYYWIFDRLFNVLDFFLLEVV